MGNYIHHLPLKVLTQDHQVTTSKILISSLTPHFDDYLVSTDRQQVGACQKVLISVVIPFFNARRWIRDTLQSVVSQGLSELEVIAVDDGSTDDTAVIINEEFDFVRIVRTKHQGPSHARNIGTC